MLHKRRGEAVFYQPPTGGVTESAVLSIRSMVIRARGGKEPVLYREALDFEAFLPFCVGVIRLYAVEPLFFPFGEGIVKASEG